MGQEKKTQGGVFFVRRTCGTTKQTTVLTQVGGIKYNNNNIRKEKLKTMTLVMDKDKNHQV